MIYTKTGDSGTTALIGVTRVSKSHPRVEAYGTVDELGAHIALLADQLAPQPAFDAPHALLQQVQRQLFTIQTLLALEPNPPHPSGIDIEGYSAQLATHCNTLEQAIDTLQAALPPFRGFVIPGGNAISSQCHVARTVCRRAERRIAALAEVAVVGDDIQKYINRLSDFLFVLAKIINFNNNQSEIIWQNACK